MSFQFDRLAISDIVLIKPPLYQDERGFFMETYRQSDFVSLGILENFVQDCHSKSSYSVLRGLHYQKGKAQGKLVRVIKGKIFDVVVDIRVGSPTYGKSVATELSEENKFILYVPVGFAHGFCVLSDTAEILYKMTGEYSAEEQCGILWNDSDLDIHWPIKNPVLSSKDQKFPKLKDTDTGFVY